ncbi:hypothetical protein L7F22_068546 [Adiantum nelumboides]|nr:hypothetical protein [Adiantum nelumboides]
MATGSPFPDFSKLSLTTHMNASHPLAHSHQLDRSTLDSSDAQAPLHAPRTGGHSAALAASSNLQLDRCAVTSEQLQEVAALAREDSFREEMHLFINHSMDLSTFAHAYPSVDSQLIRRVMQRVASRMPTAFRLADVLIPDPSMGGLPMLKWTTSSSFKYFLSDTEYNFLYDTERSRMLGRISYAKLLELTQTPGPLEVDLLRKCLTLSRAELRPPDLLLSSVNSAQQELVSFSRNTLEVQFDGAQPQPRCTRDAVEAQPTQSISLLHFLMSETNLLLADIQQRQRDWAEYTKSILNAYDTLRSDVGVAQLVGTTEGATRLPTCSEKRARFLATAELHPPPVLRVIDIKSTCQAKKVVLMDYWAHEVQQAGYSAISHTYGIEVYDVFNCQCTSEFGSTHVSPRCLVGPCPHNASVSQEGCETRNRVVKDILGMCENLYNAGAEYVWHDGVCIAQHDDAEVAATIKCMGWVYASAKETIIFLHYVGKPMAPIRPGKEDERTSRWHTRVWTLQEAALSKCRRYCVRVGTASCLGKCQSLEEFEKEITLWYKDESSKIEVIEEERFVQLIWEVYTVLRPLLVSYTQTRSSMDLDIMDDLEMWRKGLMWIQCLHKLISELFRTCFNFPNVEEAIRLGAVRESKHVGDHINCI